MIRPNLEVMKTVRGPLSDYFETGCEGVYWIVQDENHIDKDAKVGGWSYEGLNILGPDVRKMTIFKNGEKIWSGDPKMKGTLEALKNKDLCDYVTNHKYETGYVRTQLLFHGLWVHHLPANIDLDLWKEIMFNKDDNINYIAEVEINENNR